MSKTIKFDHSPTGEINLDNGVTSYADVFFLGALTLTSESIYPDKKTHYTKYATNKEGLEYAVMSAGELISALHNSIQAVSSYMAYVDAEEVKDDYQSIAWLIRGLSEMAEMVSVSREDMQHTLTFYDEIPKINQSTLLSSINEKVGIFNKRAIHLA